VVIAAPPAGVGQLYFARITVIQDGASIGDGPFEYSGSFEDVKHILDAARFVGAQSA
jgi:hypothetical protein